VKRGAAVAADLLPDVERCGQLPGSGLAASGSHTLCNSGVRAAAVLHLRTANEFYTDLVSTVGGFKGELIAERDAIEREAQNLFKAGDDQAAHDLITDDVKQRLL
jgi:hypothetical protein